MASHDGLDRSSGKILSVNPQPVGGPTGEVHPTLFVDIAEVAAPVPTVARRAAHGFLVAVVPLEWSYPEGVDDLPYALLGIDKPSLVVETGPGDLGAVGVDDDDAL